MPTIPKQGRTLSKEAWRAKQTLNELEQMVEWFVKNAEGYTVDLLHEENSVRTDPVKHGMTQQQVDGLVVIRSNLGVIAGASKKIQVELRKRFHKKFMHR